MKKTAILSFLLFVLVSFYSTNVLAVSYDTNKYYWDCGKQLGPLDECLKERILPLNYYPIIAIGFVLAFSFFFYLKYKRKVSSK